jgi:hypothetical protein
VLPEVESPIPDTIGLGTIFAAAGAGGVLLLVLATMFQLPAMRRDALSRFGMTLGFLGGSALYLVALLNQLLCRQ